MKPIRQKPNPERNLWVRVPLEPVAQPRHRVAVVGGKAHAYAAPRSHPIHTFKAAVALAASEAMQERPPWEGPIAVDIEFVFARPASMRWKTKAMIRTWHQKRPDLDNIIKAVKDALTGVVWRDDSQVARLNVSKWTAGGEEAPHTNIAAQKLGG